MNPAVWYFARSAGIVAYVLLSAAVVGGTLISARAPLAWPRFAVEELHRFLAILAGVFVAIHGASLLLDTYVPTSLAQEIVPFSSRYRPFAVGLGVTAAELLAAVGISNLLRGRLPRGAWRTVHYLTIPAWVLASAHGVVAGTDRGEPWFAGVVAAAAAAVCLAFGVRTRALRAA